MSTHDHAPIPDDDGSVKEQIPHSGVHHDEAPVHIDSMPLQEAFDSGRLETPKSPAALLETGTIEPRSGWSLTQKIGATAATLIVGAGAALGISKAMGGGNEAEPTNTAPTVSAPANPVETQPAAPTEQQLQRESMHYAYESDYFVDDAYYDGTDAGSGEGPIGAPDATPYVDQNAAAEVASDFLNNIVVATETGNNDALLAAFGQVAPNQFGEVQDEVDQIRSQNEQLQSIIETDPSFPVSSLTLQQIESVSPDPSDKNKVSITFTVLRVGYGNYVAGQGATEFKTLESWSVDFTREEVKGWSDKPADQYTTMWVGTNKALNSSETLA